VDPKQLLSQLLNARLTQTPLNLSYEVPIFLLSRRYFLMQVTGRLETIWGHRLLIYVHWDKACWRKLKSLKHRSCYLLNLWL